MQNKFNTYRLGKLIIAGIMIFSSCAKEKDVITVAPSIKYNWEGNYFSMKIYPIPLVRPAPVVIALKQGLATLYTELHRKAPLKGCLVTGIALLLPMLLLALRFILILTIRYISAAFSWMAG